MGGMNTKVYSDKAGREEVMWKHLIGIINTNGEVFADVCAFNYLVIGSSAFQSKLCTKQLGSHQMGKQIDHISIGGKRRRRLLDTRSKKKADVESDHHILLGTLRINLKCTDTANRPHKQYNVEQLISRETKLYFNCEVINRSEALEYTAENTVDTV